MDPYCAISQAHRWAPEYLRVRRAEGGGVFSLNIVNRGEQAAVYELTLQKVVSLDERFRPGGWSDPDPSPRIQALRKQIAAGETNTEVWKEIGTQGTPLV